MERLKSRKFLLTLSAMLTSLAAALAGEIIWRDAIVAIVGAVMAYVGGEAYVDGQRERGR